VTGSSRQQFATDLRTTGRGHELLDNPRGLALRFMRHDGLLGASDHDDVLSDAMWGIAKALETWDEYGEVALTTWCWWKMRSEVHHGRRHRARFNQEHPVDWAEMVEPGAAEHEGRKPSIPDPGWLRIDLTEYGYKRVEDRVTLQRWADMAHLTDAQADILAVLAVHGGTIVRHTHLRGDPLMARLRSGPGGEWSSMKFALTRMRRVAATGVPWFRGSKHAKPPSFTLDDVREAVTG
jgi:hypothetical protein